MEQSVEMVRTCWKSRGDMYSERVSINGFDGRRKCGGWSGCCHMVLYSIFHSFWSLVACGNVHQTGVAMTERLISLSTWTHLLYLFKLFLLLETPTFMHSFFFILHLTSHLSFLIIIISLHSFVTNFPLSILSVLLNHFTTDFLFFPTLFYLHKFPCCIIHVSFHGSHFITSYVSLWYGNWVFWKKRQEWQKWEFVAVIRLVVFTRDI